MVLASERSQQRLDSGYAQLKPESTSDYASDKISGQKEKRQALGLGLARSRYYVTMFQSQFISTQIFYMRFSQEILIWL